MRCVKCNSHFCWVCGGPFEVGTRIHPTFYSCKAKKKLNASSLADHLAQPNLTLEQELRLRIQFHRSNREFGFKDRLDFESTCQAAHHVLRLTYVCVCVCVCV